jgi:hypothetical protein
MDENVSTTAIIAQEQFPFLMRDALQKLGREIKQSVKEEFDNRRKQYSNKPITTEYKGAGKGALVDSGDLEQAVTEWDENKEILLVQTGESYHLEVNWSLPMAGMKGVYGAKRSRPDYVYMWAHEGGTENTITNILAHRSKGGFALIKAKTPWRLPQRDFFIDGVQKGIDKGSQLAAANMYAATDLETISKRAPYVSTGTYKFPMPPGMGGLLPKLLPAMSFTSLIWYVVPPSQMYAVIGMASDIMGFLKGSFFSFGMFGGYARQVAWGQVGMTKKIYRRKIRGGLWYGV